MTVLTIHAIKKITSHHLMYSIHNQPQTTIHLVTDLGVGVLTLQVYPLFSISGICATAQKIYFITSLHFCPLMKYWPSYVGIDY